MLWSLLVGLALSVSAGCVGQAELERVERALDQLARESRSQEARWRALSGAASQSPVDQAVIMESPRATAGACAQEADRAGERARALEEARASVSALRASDAESVRAWDASARALGPVVGASGVWGLGGMLVGAGLWGVARGLVLRRGLERVGRALEQAAAEDPGFAEALRRRREDLDLIRSPGVRRMLESAEPAQRLEAGSAAGYRD